MIKQKNQSGLHRYGLGLLGTFLLFCMLLIAPVWASETVTEPRGTTNQRVYDMAGLLSDWEIADFEETIADYRKEMKMDFVVVTTNDAEGKSATAYADDFFDYGGFGYGNGRDGVLFLIDMDNRELTLSTSGNTIRLLTDERIERILDDVYKGASDEDFGDSVKCFLEDMAYYHNKGIQSNQYNYDTETGKVSVYRSIRLYEFFLALIVSGAVAGSACLGVISSYGMKKQQRKSAKHLMAYRAESKFILQNQGDNLVNKFVTTRIIPRKTTGSSSGGSGRSSSGRSSSHRSSSGRSHGGGSRKF